MTYEECIPTSTERSVSDAVTHHACSRLGLSPVGIRFFGESTGEPVAKGYLKGEPFEAEGNICGFSSWLMLKDVHTVWVRTGLSQKELVVTIAHELYHFYENKSITPTNESKAEAFGRQVYEELTDWRYKLY